ncbi:MAG: 4-hydroxy-3-methylbut-2-enyl diphosphate reductase [bacterium]|nr:4-hydroxy-3-methylbut-2-enyl diphosphate reductase [bacterium]
MKIEIASGCGFCSGVKRAIKLAESSAGIDKEVYTLGPIIHNLQVVQSLEKKGVRAVDSIDKIGRGTVIFRSHGVQPEDFIKAKEKHLKIVDGTCPIVSRVQKLAEKLTEEGYSVVIVGDPNHPEVEGIVSRAKDAIVVQNPDEVKAVRKKRLGIIAQTTQTLSNLRAVTSQAMGNASEIKVYNTICKAVLALQESSCKLAKRVDILLVVGGVSSANTKRLFLLAKEINPNTYHIEGKDYLRLEWFKEAKKIGLTAGTSTPSWVIDEVVKKIMEVN